MDTVGHWPLLQLACEAHLKKVKLCYFVTSVGEMLWTTSVQCFVYTVNLCINSAFNLWLSSSVQIGLEILFLESKKFMLCTVFNVEIFCVLVSISVNPTKLEEHRNPHRIKSSTCSDVLHTLHMDTVLAVPLLSHCIMLAPSSSLVLWRKKLNSSFLLEWEGGVSGLQRNFPHVE